MEENFRKQAKSQGFTDQEIDDYLSGLNTTQQEASQPQEQPTYQPPPSQLLGQSPSPTPEQQVKGNPPPDVVAPFTNPGTEMTQGFGYGHTGEDLINPNPEMTNPIGGVPFSGTVADPSGQYYAGYGNYQGVIGANPQELAQMTPEEKVRMSSDANNYMAQNPADITGMANLFPGKNVNVQAHLANPVVSDPQGVATGSAKLQMGTTGHSTGNHVHEEMINVQGQLIPISELLGGMLYR